MQRPLAFSASALAANALVNAQGFRMACAAIVIVLLQACDSGADTRQQASQADGDTVAPSVPAGLVATASSATQIDLSWTASTDSGGSGLAGYRIYRNGATTPTASVGAAITTYADTGLTAATQYGYTVRAYDGAANESASSAAATATTQSAGATGLDSRPSNTTCTAWDHATGGTSVSVVRYTDLSFAGALAMTQAPNDDANFYVVQQSGLIKRFSKAALTVSAAALDISARVRSGDGETGLLGMAFHPAFPTTNRVFLSYTATDSGQLVSRISEFTTTPSSGGGVTIDAASESILLTVNQPEANHNGGNIAFGPDGNLYIGLGDGGGGGDDHGTDGNGQRLTTLLGKILRIDVNSGSPYRIPSSNPYAGNAVCPAAGRASGACPEIYALGFRNPWRWSFDRGNGELWVGDVGQNAYEEVDKVTLGGNYGWRCREGAHDYNSAGTPACATATVIDPVAEYGRAEGYSITGGYVYRGPQTTTYRGRYIFGDYGSGKIWAWIPESAAAPRQPTLLVDTDIGITSFAQGNDGDLYVIGDGRIHHLLFQGGAPGTVPPTLTASGCVAATDAKQPAAGLIPYDVNAPFWSDGASKSRWLALPEGSKITVADSGDWELPNGSVLMKNFTVGGKLVETRLFARHTDGEWTGASYEWNAGQTDATLVSGGAVRDIGGGQNWIFPSESQCLECHTDVAGGSLGLETAQLNRDVVYAATGRTANELLTLSHIGVLDKVITDPSTQAALPDPEDTSAPLADRARAYLHTNCSQCHRTGGPTPSSMDLRYTTALSATNACNAAPQSGVLELGAGAKLIAPGSAANSILVNRVNRRDQNAMPPVGSNKIDTTGVALLTQWVDSLTGC